MGLKHTHTHVDVDISQVKSITVHIHGDGVEGNLFLQRKPGWPKNLTTSFVTWGRRRQHLPTVQSAAVFWLEWQAS